MATPATNLPDLIENGFRDHSCVIAPILGAVGVGSIATGTPLLGGLILPGALLAAGRCLGAPYNSTRPPGYGSPAPNGQCRAGYSMNLGWTRYIDSSGAQASTDLSRNAVLGPITVTRFDLRFGLQTTDQAGGMRITDGNGAVIVNITDAFGIVPGTYVYELTPWANNPDNCGAQPPIYLPSPPTLPLPPITRDPDGNPILPPYNKPLPYQPDPSVPPIWLPVVFPPIILKPDISFPISIPINLGGIDVGGINLKFDGTFEISFSQGKGGESKDYTAILNEIRNCACPKPTPPVCTYDTVDIPYLDTSDSGEPCKVSTFKLQVAPGGLSSVNAARLASTSAAALSGCQAEAPVQQQEVLIAVGTVPSPAVEQFTPPIPPEVVSIRVRITSIPPELSKVFVYPAADQYKFGSVAFSLLPARAGGDYVYLFDQDTYIPLPRRAKPGVIRLLLKGGVGWEVYDTGERL